MNSLVDEHSKRLHCEGGAHDQEQVTTGEVCLHQLEESGWKIFTEEYNIRLDKATALFTCGYVVLEDFLCNTI